MKVAPPTKKNFESYYSIEDIDNLTEWVELDSMLATLPIGIKKNNVYIPNTEYKTFVFTGNHEIALGDLEDRYGRDNMLRIFQYFIPEILESLDNTPFDNITDTKNNGERGKRPLRGGAFSPPVGISNSRYDFIGDMYVGDVAALITNVRIRGQHWGVPISCTCPCQRAFKIRPASEDDYHDLRGLKFNVWRGSREPLFEYKLLRPIPNRDSIILSPAKLKYVFDDGFRNSQLAQDSKESILLSDIDEITYEQLKSVDRENLKEWANKVNSIGMEKAIEMFCPECDDNWESPLILGINHPDFILSLLQAPKGEKGDTRDYLFELAKFLMMGEQAPFKSASEVLNLTPKIRNNMVTSLSESYQEQARKMKK